MYIIYSYDIKPIHYTYYPQFNGIININVQITIKSMSVINNNNNNNGNVIIMWDNIGSVFILT